MLAPVARAVPWCSLTPEWRKSTVPSRSAVQNSPASLALSRRAITGRAGLPARLRAGCRPLIVVAGSTSSGIKESLRVEIDGKQSRRVINELLLQLEATNPTPSPTSSELLTGGWSFAYNGSVAPGLFPSPTRPIALAMYAGGFTPGNFGLAVASMLPKDFLSTENFKLSIAGIGPYSSSASIDVKLMDRNFSVKVNCELKVESGIRLKETYKSLEVSGRSTEVPASLQYERVLYISYLDEDLMVARDETGAPDVLYRIAPAGDEDQSGNNTAWSKPAAVAPVDEAATGSGVQTKVGSSASPDPEVKPAPDTATSQEASMVTELRPEVEVEAAIMYRFDEPLAKYSPAHVDRDDDVDGNH